MAALQVKLYDGGLKVSVIRNALFANCSQVTVVSLDLARELNLSLGDEVDVSCPYSRFNYTLNLPKSPIHIEHSGVQSENCIMKLCPLINTRPAFYDIILGRDFMEMSRISFFGDFLSIKPTPGPGFREDVSFMGHNVEISPKTKFDLQCMSADYTLRFDGVSRGNPGHSGGAASLIRRVENSTEECIWVDSKYFGNSITSNQAEYLALILGLKKCVDNVISVFQKRICIQGDSELIIKQFRGDSVVKHENLVPLYNEANELMQRLPHKFLLQWIPRELNGLCDAVANQCIDRELGI